MNSRILIEAFGYLGSALVVISMLMTSVFKLRVINMIGSIIFAVYALIIKSYPTALMNFFLVGINIYHLLQLERESPIYQMIMLQPGDTYLRHLLEEYGEDIRRYFPDFHTEDAAGADIACMICCEDTAAGILLGESGKDGSVRIMIDYATPKFRDLTVGKYLYSKLGRDGIRQLVYTGDNEEHLAYVVKAGFRKRTAGYILDL